jgi:MFS family permease
VFKLPLTRLHGLDHSAATDWSQPEVQWMYSLALCMLGAAAALFGRWVERVGPRCTMFTAALCFCGGLAVTALGVHLHSLWLVYVGYGGLGGIGLGLGYISPVSTLIKWFPDRPGMATGLAIMGFGGGAMIGSNASVWLMEQFRTASDQGVVATLLTLAAAYFALMLFGAFAVRVPPEGFAPRGFVATTPAQLAPVAVGVGRAWRTPQFWLLWAVLCCNVTAGIGILEQASPMAQEIFAGRVSAGAAAGFVGILSLANLLGRFVWSSASDRLGRKVTYSIYFLLGAALYATLPSLGRGQHVGAFVLVAVVVISMYGGGFATIPAYLRDLFGSFQVGAIHGRLLTAWSVAALVGPSIVNWMRESRVRDGLRGVEAYDTTLYVMAALLLVGVLCNLLVKPVHPQHHHREATAASKVPTTPGEVHAEQGATPRSPTVPEPAPTRRLGARAATWTIVLVPLAYGVYQTIRKALALFA